MTRGTERPPRSCCRKNTEFAGRALSPYALSMSATFRRISSPIRKPLTIGRWRMTVPESPQNSGNQGYFPVKSGKSRVVHRWETP